MKYPDLGKKNQMIGWRPIIQEENKPRGKLYDFNLNNSLKLQQQ